jgi:hypothetical protein
MKINYMYFFLLALLERLILCDDLIEVVTKSELETFTKFEITNLEDH